MNRDIVRKRNVFIRIPTWSLFPGKILNKYKVILHNRLHVKLDIDRVVSPMQGLGYHNGNNDAHYATKQKSYVIVSFKNCGKYRCQVWIYQLP